jgi:HlyD family secretion protein
MQNRHLPKPVIPLVIIALAVGIYLLVTNLTPKTPQNLTVSGTIEAVTTILSPEIGGRTAEVFVEEGTTVHTGDPLFRLDDTLLQTQRNLAVANVDLSAATLINASTQADVTHAAIRAESIPSRSVDWTAVQPDGFTLPGGYFSRDELISAANIEMKNALTARDEVKTTLMDLFAAPTTGSSSTEFEAAEMRLANGRAAFLVAQDVLKQAKLSGNTDLIDIAQTASDTAKSELENAQTAYDDLEGTDAAIAIISARASLTAAQARYDLAQDRVASLQTGEQSLRWKASDAALEQANRAAEQANAQLALIDVQISKLTILAPISGVVITRSVQVGEVLAPGSAAITIAQLDPLTITVFVPESDYGNLSIGQSANISVDSFPGVVFTAKVIHISDQAEFTPRNVQTTEGRKSTVFAVKLQIENPDNKLKPGMPADLTFVN